MQYSFYIPKERVTATCVCRHDINTLRNKAGLCSASPPFRVFACGFNLLLAIATWGSPGLLIRDAELGMGLLEAIKLGPCDGILGCAFLCFEVSLEWAGLIKQHRETKGSLQPSVRFTGPPVLGVQRDSHLLCPGPLSLPACCFQPACSQAWCLLGHSAAAPVQAALC